MNNLKTTRCFITIKKVAKIILNLNAWFIAILLRAFKIIDFPVPPFNDRLRTSGRSIRHYYESGITTYLPIVTFAMHAGINLNASLKVLDFGCGVARQLLHFSRKYPNNEYYACDVSDSAIDFIKKKYLQVQSYKNEFTPPLIYSDNFFDIIYSVSIFSHLSIKEQTEWLHELARITKKDGYCFLTTEGYNALSIMRRQHPSKWGDTSDKMLREKGFIYKEYSDFHIEKSNENFLQAGSKFVGIENSYGAIVISPSFIRDTWPNFGFEVVSIIEGIIDKRQDLVVMRKK